ncbi:MAG: protein-export chaperone SecB [Bdellovibrionales bacterium]
MAEKKKTAKKAPAKTKTPSKGKSEQPMQSLPLQVHAQYVRDVSFENPNAPDSLRGGQEAPKIDISFNMDARNLKDDNADALYEVALKVTANATRGDKTVFIAEVEYGAVVELSQVPEDKHHPLLLVEVPRLTFPFVRQIMSNLTQSGGYPPLNLNPVDFGQLYLQRFAKQTPDKKSA